MSTYSKYRGRSIGRILHGLYTYHSPYYVDQMIIYDGKVNLHRKTIANYTWEGEDTPIFDFVDERWNKRQKILKPFLDDECYQSPEYIVQELRNLLTINEAFELRWFKYKNDWAGSISMDKIKNKIKNKVKKLTFYKYNDEWHEKHWRHFAECSILEI